MSVCGQVEEEKQTTRKTAAGKRLCQSTNVNVCVMHNMSHVKTERTYTCSTADARQKLSVVVIGLSRSYHHQPYPESVVPIFSRVLVYEIRQYVSRKDRLCCSSCPLDSRICRGPPSSALLQTSSTVVMFCLEVLTNQLKKISQTLPQLVSNSYGSPIQLLSGGVTKGSAGSDLGLAALDSPLEIVSRLSSSKRKSVFSASCIAVTFAFPLGVT